MALVHRIKGARNARLMAIAFGVGKAKAVWLSLRYLVTGRTGRYRLGAWR